MRLLVHWFLSAVSLVIVAWIVPGIQVAGFGRALLAAAVIGLVNATLGVLLRLITWPLTMLTLGLLLVVINALMLRLAAALVPGFEVRGFVPALVGAILLGLVNIALRYVVLMGT